MQECRDAFTGIPRILAVIETVAAVAGTEQEQLQVVRQTTQVDRHLAGLGYGKIMHHFGAVIFHIQHVATAIKRHIVVAIDVVSVVRLAANQRNCVAAIQVAAAYL